MNEYQRKYQKDSPKARAARKKYYELNKHKWRNYSRKYRADPENRAKATLLSIRSRAKVNNIEFSLELEDVYPYPAVCPVLGIPLEAGGGKHNPNSPTVSRIDLSKGYTKDNVRIISLKASRYTLDSSAIEDYKKILQFLEKHL